MLAWVTAAHALDPAYLADWPAVERVLADHQGKDRADTLARQMAALHQLDRAIEEMAGPRRWHGLTPDENRLRSHYGAASGRIRDEVNSTLPNELSPGFHGPLAKPPLRKWYALQWQYERDLDVRAATLGRYLSPATLQRLEVEIAGSDARIGKAPVSRGPDDRDLDRIGVLMLVAALGAVVALSIRFLRRRRTNARASSAGTASPSDPELAEAADEVMDSLEPYLAAALAGRQHIPYSDMTDPYTISFLLEYCKAALTVVTGTGDVSREHAIEVLTWLAGTPRFQAIVGGGAPNPSATGKIARSARIDGLFGGGFARLVLNEFVGRQLSGEPARNEPAPATVARTEFLVNSIRGNVTRLHPAGPHAAAAHQSIVIFLTCHLLDMAKTPG